MSDFENFRARMDEARKNAEQYADKDAINAQLDQVQKLWEQAQEIVALRENPSIQAALESIERAADSLAYNILNCDTSSTPATAVLSSVAKYQALEQMRGLFFPTGAEEQLDSVAADLEVKKIAPDAVRVGSEPKA